MVVVPGAVALETFQEILERYAFADTLKIRLSPGYYDLLATRRRSLASQLYCRSSSADSAARLTGFVAFAGIVIDYGIGILASILTLPIMFVSHVMVAYCRLRRVFQTLESVEGLGGKIFDATFFL